MAVTPFKTFAGGEILTASDLNSSLSQVFDNGEDLGWPATKAKDLNGNELILDVDADTSITADTDDQIDIKVGGTDVVKVTATVVDINGLELILDADADTSIHAGTDDQMDFKLGGSDRAFFTTGGLNLKGNLLIDASLENYTESSNIIGSIGGGAQTIDLEAGNSVTATVDTSETTFTFGNAAGTGPLERFTLALTNGGSQTVNWPSSVDWPGGVTPTLTAAGVDLLVFRTWDGGTIWHGIAISLDSK